MDKALYRLLNQERKKSFSLRGKTVEMRLLSASELLEMIKEESDDPLKQAIYGGAALAAACLEIQGRPVFDHAQEALKVLSLEEINALMEAYQTWSAEINPGVQAPEEDVEALKKA